MDSLESFFWDNPRVAIACSGGVDSTYLLHFAVRMGVDVLPIIVDSQFIHRGEIDSAVGFCRSEGLEPHIITMDVLKVDGIGRNPPDRCYHCKRAMFTAIREVAESKGYHTIIDGTNASDDSDERPGMRALKELGIHSPLREAGLEKTRIREMAHEDGVITWNKESNSCLATRLSTGIAYTGEILDRISRGEDAIHDLGLTGFRLRTDGESATLVVPGPQYSFALSKSDAISEAVSEWFPELSIVCKDI